MCHIHSTYVKHLHIRTPHVSGTVFVYIQSTCVKHIHMHTYTRHILVHLHSRCTFSPCKRSQGLSGAVYLPASPSLHVACCLPLFFPHHPRLAPPSFKADYTPGKVPTNRTPLQYTTTRCITLHYAALRRNTLQHTAKHVKKCQFVVYHSRFRRHCIHNFCTSHQCAYTYRCF